MTLLFRIVFTTLTILSSLAAYPQGPGFDVPKIEDLVKIPPSPEAQAFAKYGNTPVNLYTGSPDISIPIANLQGREISVPITLTYDASGIKVEQIATWVGLGWNLNVGGMVTRQVNANPDDYINANPILKPFYQSGISSEYDFVNGFTAYEGIPGAAAGDLTRYFAFLFNVTRSDVTTYKYEIEPDTYSFSALGLSGTLFIDYTLGIAYCMEHPEIKAYPTFLEVAGIKNITAWKIVDGSGNAFYFDLAERTYTYEGGATDIVKDYNSAWMLTKVESTNKRDIVLFNYSSPTQWQQPQLAGRGEMRNDRYENGTACGNDDVIPAPVPLYKIYQVELLNIQINGVQVASFIPSTIERKDLKSRKFLANIKLFGEPSTVVKRFKFIRSYFGDSTQTNEKLVRLRLDALEVFGDVTSTTPERYTFSYEPGDLPSRESMAQDYWGYYNGVPNATLIPKNYYYDAQNLSFGGADRSPVFQHGKIASLVKIKYPTGGTTNFSYRPHKTASPVHAWTTATVPGSATLTGGRDDNDPFGYLACDDATNIPPRGVVSHFYLPTTQGLKVTIQASGESMAGLQMQYVTIYKVPGIGQKATNPPFCEVLNGGGGVTKIVEFSGTLASQTIDYGNLSFSSGHYRIMVLNTNPKLTVSVTASGTATTGSYEVGGQRIASIVDNDDNGMEVSARYFYYGDVSALALSSITRDYLSTSTQNAGNSHGALDFEEAKTWRRYNTVSGLFETCGSLMRYSSNRTKAHHHVTYPVVSEVQFGSPGKNTFNGFTVTEFRNEPDSYVNGYSKRTVLNGRVSNKAVFDNLGIKLQEEKTYYSQASVGGKLGFVFYSTSSSSKDTYVVSEIYNQGLGQYYIKKDPETPNLTHCAWNGAAVYPFSDSGFHNCGYGCINHAGSTCHPPYGSGYPVATSHPSYSFYVSLESQGKSPTMYHHNLSGIVTVSYSYYNIHYCKAFSSDYQKVPYLFPRYLARTDSTKTFSYIGTNTLTTTSTNTYNTSTHYQVTLIKTKDSKGDIRQWQNYYPHELQSSNPSDPAWQALMDQNRVAQPVKIEAKYGSALTTDYTKLTKFKSISSTNGTMWVPDVIQFSSGTGTPEDRIKFHQYDNAGNVIEVSKINDSKVAYLWGYTQAMPIAEVKGSASADFAYTSFEEGSSQGGWTYTISSSTTEFKSGVTSHKLSSGSMTRSGLTAGTTYILSYWAKGGTPTVSGGVQSSNDAAAAESDGWKYFEKTIIGITSLTLTAAASPTLYLDEVRIYPKGSLVTTFTYKRGIGQTSKTDATNRMTYFEYDEMGRLKFIRDHDKNVLKQNAYHFRTGEVPTGVN